MIKKRKTKRKKLELLADIYGMLMVLLIEVESQRTRRDGKKYHWDEIEHDLIKYSSKKMKEYGWFYNK